MFVLGWTLLCCAGCGKRPPFGVEETILNFDSKTNRFVDDSGVLHAVASSPNGRFVACASATDAFIVWDYEKRQELEKTQIGTGGVRSVAFSPDGRILATGHGDGIVRLWDFENRKLSHPTDELPCHLGAVRALAMPVATIIVAGGDDRTLCCWERTSQGWKERWKQPEAHLRAISAVAAMWQRERFAREVGPLLIANALPPRPVDGEYDRTLRFLVASASHDGTISLWNEDGNRHKWNQAPQSPRDRLDAQDWIAALAFSPDAEKLISVGNDNDVRFWHIERGEPIRYEWKTKHGDAKHSHPVRALSLTNDGKLLATTDESGLIRVWDVAGAVWDGSPQGNIIREVTTFRGHRGWVTSLDFLARIPPGIVDKDPDKSKFVTTGIDKTLRLWHVPDGPHQTALDPQTLAGLPLDDHVLLMIDTSFAMEHDLPHWKNEVTRALEQLRGRPGAECNILFFGQNNHAVLQGGLPPLNANPANLTMLNDAVAVQKLDGEVNFVEALREAKTVLTNVNRPVQIVVITAAQFAGPDDQQLLDRARELFGPPIGPVRIDVLPARAWNGARATHPADSTELNLAKLSALFRGRFGRPSLKRN